VFRLKIVFFLCLLFFLACAREKDVPLVIQDEPFPMLGEIALEPSENLIQGLSFPKDAQTLTLSMTWQVRQSATGIPRSGIRVTEEMKLTKKECESLCFEASSVDVQTSPPVDEIEDEVTANLENAFLEVIEEGFGPRTTGPREFQNAVVKLVPFLQNKVLGVGTKIPFAHKEEREVAKDSKVILSYVGEYTFVGAGRLQGKEKRFFVVTLRYDVEGVSKGEKVASGIGKGVFLFDCEDKGLSLAQVNEQIMFSMTTSQNKRKAKKLTQLQIGTLNFVVEE